MTKELEEILEYLIDTDKYIEDYGYQYKRLSLHDTCQLLNYITNLQQNYNKLQDEYQEQYTYEYNLRKQLQQDLDKANNIIEKDRQFYKCRMDEYVDLKKENEELKQTLHNITINGVEEENTTVLDLIKENEILRKNAEHNDKVVDKARWNEMIYKSRCKKAIEYIKQRTEFGEYDYAFPSVLNQDEVRKIRNILKGSDEE